MRIYVYIVYVYIHGTFLALKMVLDFAIFLQNYSDYNRHP